MEYKISATRVDAHGSLVKSREAELLIDTDLNGRPDVLNPAELLLAALSACILKNMERIAPKIQFAYRGVSVKVHGVRQDTPPKMARIDYTIEVDSDENDRKRRVNAREYPQVRHRLQHRGARHRTNRHPAPCGDRNMKHRQHSACALLLFGCLGLCGTASAGPWHAAEQNTSGWYYMTPDERIAHQRRMRSFETYEECKAYQVEHHALMAERARQQGVELQPRAASGCDQLRQRGQLQ